MKCTELDPANYIPIFLNPIASVIMERLIKKQLTIYFDGHKLFTTSQNCILQKKFSDTYLYTTANIEM